MIRRFALALLCTVFGQVAAGQQASEAFGAQLRGIDKISGEIYDILIPAGQSAALDRIGITLNSCRYPVGNPAGDAYASIEVTDLADDAVLFSGWMIASSPALSALDHPRYDIWVIRCTTS